MFDEALPFVCCRSSMMLRHVLRLPTGAPAAFRALPLPDGCSVQTSCRPLAGLLQTSCRPLADLLQTRSARAATLFAPLE
ncbi:hypothetical protein EYF80_021863 [Liparis tanakae]|uniref:Uncharacterized protein n=1 Tax=Liparis tanakae TaxID=230148 RepID=A0A4Z2HSB7_9TELE|nr:hypothetical protein EYF80_021863 [Liparis tanakae]